MAIQAGVMIGGILGLVAGVVPKALEVGTRHLEFKRELKLRELDRKMAADGYRAKRDAANAKDLISARQPEQIMSVALANSLKGGATTGWRFSILFVLFGIIDALRASVRPLVTYGVIGFWIFHRLSSGLAWTDLDSNIMLMVLVYWFSARAIEKWDGSPKAK